MISEPGHLPREIGCIGLGLLGSALSERLLVHGWRVSGFDPAADRRDELARRGGRAVDSAAQAARSSPVLLCLPDSDCVDAVVAELAPVFRPGLTLIDTTTGDPDRTAERGRRLAESGVSYLDATVGGSSEQARRGEILLLAGGESDVIDRCRPVLETLAARVFLCGPCGAGARMKLVLNLVLGLNRAVLAEGLAFAEACGLDPRFALEVLNAGPAASAVMETKGRRMLDGDFAPQARLRQHLKDVRLILESGTRHGARLPLSELHARLLDALVQAGAGDLDNSAIIQAFQRTAAG